MWNWSSFVRFLASFYFLLVFNLFFQLYNRAGQWARRLCINDSLDTGSILPYLEKCKELGYGVIVLNPNAISVLKKLEGPKKENGVYVKRKGHNGLSEEYESISVEENETEFAHVNYVWEHFISKSVAHNLVFVAHSFGGYLATQLIADKGIIKSFFFFEKSKPKIFRARNFLYSQSS